MQSWHSRDANFDSHPKAEPWRFESRTGCDTAFHPLVSKFGASIIMDLDEIVLDSPVQAAIRATKVFQRYNSQAGSEDAEADTRHLMGALAQALKPKEHLLDDLALVPPQAVFHGNARPRN